MTTPEKKQKNFLSVNQSINHYFIVCPEVDHLDAY